MQSLSDIEVICIDDGSTDGSFELLKKYESETANFIVLSQNREGPGAARNKGIKLAKGEYICVIDSDDYYPSENTLEVLYNIAVKKNVVMCGGNIINVSPDGNISDSFGNFEEEGMRDSRVCPILYGQTRFVYKRFFLINNGISYMPYTRFEDPPFVLSAILAAGKYYVICENVYVRRVLHKGIYTNEDIAWGIIQGILKCMELVVEHGLKDLYFKELSNILMINIDYIFPFVVDEKNKLWNGIGQYNKLAEVFEPNKEHPFSDYSAFCQYVEDIKQRVDRCKKAKKIIVYGAGNVAQKLFGTNYLNKENIVGFATTEKPEKDLLFNYKVKKISDYLTHENSSLVIVAGGEKISKDMEKTLNHFGFSDYVLITSEVLHIAWDLMKI